MHIRKLTLYDIDKVQLMLKDFKKEDSNYDKIKKFLKEDDHHMIASLDNGKIVGYALAYELARIDGKENMLYVHDIDVLEDYRGNGIGKSIMEELKSLCTEQKLYKMFLLVDPFNKPAIGLYESCNGMREESYLYTFKCEIE